ncbi:hypothetical protein [Duncaniella dubosii]
MQTTNENNDEQRLDRAINLAYEIEGLLMLHISRGEEAARRWDNF